MNLKLIGFFLQQKLFNCKIVDSVLSPADMFLILWLYSVLFPNDVMFSHMQHLGHAQGDDYTLDDMFVTASATTGTTIQEDKRIKEKAAHGK